MVSTCSRQGLAALHGFSVAKFFGNPWLGIFEQVHDKEVDGENDDVALKANHNLKNNNAYKMKISIQPVFFLIRISNIKMKSVFIAEKTQASV